MPRPEHLKNAYLSKVRGIKKNPWLQIKKEDEPLFDDLAKILDAKQMDYMDYIAFHFDNPDKFMPAGKYICSTRAVQRYEIHQKMKNKYVNDDYSIDGEDFYVNKTFKKYELKQVKDGTAQDPDAHFALTMSSSGNPENSELWEAAEYALCKFLYKDKTPPTELMEFVKKCRNHRKIIYANTL